MKEPPAHEPLVMSLHRRGLYSSFGREKPLYKKLPFLANFIKKLQELGSISARFFPINPSGRVIRGPFSFWE